MVTGVDCPCVAMMKEADIAERKDEIRMSGVLSLQSKLIYLIHKPVQWNHYLRDELVSLDVARHKIDALAETWDGCDSVIVELTRICATLAMTRVSSNSSFADSLGKTY